MIKKIALVILGIICSLLIISILIVVVSRLISFFIYDIKSKQGIQESSFIEIGGIQQFISIRGEDKENPLVIFLHGGPGSPMTFVSHNYQKDLEKDFTFVNYDQRGCGRTYYKNKNTSYEISQEILLKDLCQIVEYCKKRFNKEKVIIMGHSNGTSFGLEYVKKHPENVETYIGIGQLVNARQGDIFTAKNALPLLTDAEKRNLLEKTIADYEKIDNYANFNTETFSTLRLLSHPFFKGEKEITPVEQIWLGIKSPYMNLADIRWFFTMTNMELLFQLTSPLLSYSFFEFDVYKTIGTNFQVPINFISGEKDCTTPTSMVQEYYEKVQAPKKNIFLLKECGHSPMLDDVQAFTEAFKLSCKK